MRGLVDKAAALSHAALGVEAPEHYAPAQGSRPGAPTHNSCAAANEPLGGGLPRLPVLCVGFWFVGVASCFGCRVVLRWLLFATQEVVVFDMALVSHPSGTVVVMIPASVGRALREKGFNRAVVEVTDEGILLRPYRRDAGVKRRDVVADLPAWADE